MIQIQNMTVEEILRRIIDHQARVNLLISRLVKELEERGEKVD